MCNNIFLPVFISIIIAVDHVKSTVIKNVNESEMFYYEIRPELFNWTNGILVFEINIVLSNVSGSLQF